MTTLRIIVALFIALLGAWGFRLAMLPTEGQPHHWRRAVLFYTNQSNLLVCLYHLALAAALLFNSPWQHALQKPVVQLSVSLCIMVTFLVFHFMLARSINLPPVQNRLVHYIVPLLTQAEWLLLAEKTGLGPVDALVWLLLPLAYMIFICLRAALCGNIPYSESPWPYPFMDMNKLGFGRWLRNILLMMVAFLLLGMTYVGVAKLLSLL